MMMSLENLATLATEREPACGSTRVVAIDGRSGSGKTDLARRLHDRLSTQSCTTVNVDAFVPGWHSLDQVPGILRRALADLAAGRPAHMRTWDWSQDRPGHWVELEAPDILILDGCGSGSRELRMFLSLLVWLEAPRDIRHRRAIDRDGAAFEPWWDVWARQEAALFASEQTAAAADVLIRTA